MEKLRDGDKVKIRSWKSMKNEYGMDSDGDIPVPDYFISRMKYLCRRIITVHISHGSYYFSNVDGYQISDEMLVGDCIFEGRQT